MDRNLLLVHVLEGPIVALRKESVDRNNFSRLHYNITVMVALRKESVDRNLMSSRARRISVVALRKESVDRNPGPADDRNI